MIAVSIFNAIIVTIVLKLLEFLTAFRSFGKKIASVFLAALFIFYYCSQIIFDQLNLFAKLILLEMIFG